MAFTGTTNNIARPDGPQFPTAPRLRTNRNRTGFEGAHNIGDKFRSNDVRLDILSNGARIAKSACGHLMFDDAVRTA